MFTGIVEEKGRVVSFLKGGDAWKLEVEAQKVLDGLSVGDSLAVNGCCLTVVLVDEGRIAFDLLDETVRLTNFSELREGGSVNLERSLRFDGRVGGHFVTGHIDCHGEVDTAERRGDDLFMHVVVPRKFHRYLIYKGSVAIDGVSLTVAEADETGFSVWLIPHTLEVTNLLEKKPGRRVNLEFDMLGKYVDRILEFRREGDSAS